MNTIFNLMFHKKAAGYWFNHKLSKMGIFSISISDMGNNNNYDV